MPIIIDGTGTISGVSATGLTTAQTVGYSSLPAGSVLQVVNATYATQTGSSSTTFADTGLTATITPKFSTSKILVLVEQNGINKQSGNTGVNLQLLRGASVLIGFGNNLAGNTTATENSVGGAGVSYLDSPATISATTYKTQFASTAGVAQGIVQHNGATSTITLMEIAA
jgi:hypothetical protein